jgi:hypothetical protein
MPSIDELRPVERRVLRWAEDGLTDAEIGQRFGRGERWAEQVRFLANNVDRPGAAGSSGSSGSVSSAATPHRLRPLERRILRWRQQGLDHDELSIRFRRSPGFLARVEDYAQYKLSKS